MQLQTSSVEKICHVEKFQISKCDRLGEIWNFQFLHITDVDKSEISPPLACVWCGECLHINVKFILFCCTIVFVTIYAVLSQNMFCWDSRTFVWRKFNQKLHMWWKMTNMGYGLLLPRVWNYNRLSDWRTWVGSRDAWRAWTRWLIYTDTRLRTTFWLFMDKMDKLHRKEDCKK